MTSSLARPDRRLHLLTSRDLDRSGPCLPYRLDHLRSAGWELSWTTRHLGPPWTGGARRRAVAAVERAGVPVLQTVLGRDGIAAADAVLAMFESEGTAVAALRRLPAPPVRRTAVAVLTCWLAELLPGMGRARVAGYRWAYRGADRVYVLSSNQAPVLEERLGLRAGVVRALTFGIDADRFTPVPGVDGGPIVAIGRDRGRDWPTFLRAVAGLDVEIRLACRESDRARLELPPNVTYLGFLDEDRYACELAGASVVAVPTYVRAYPSGQTVALEAMATGRCCVVTGTPAWSDYLRPDVNAIVVPPGDPHALRAGLERALGDPALRAAIGAAARADVEDRLNARAMWAEVGADLRTLRAG